MLPVVSIREDQVPTLGTSLGELRAAILPPDVRAVNAHLSERGSRPTAAVVSSADRAALTAPS